MGLGSSGPDVSGMGGGLDSMLRFLQDLGRLGSGLSQEFKVSNAAGVERKGLNLGFQPAVRVRLRLGSGLG